MLVRYKIKFWDEIEKKNLTEKGITYGTTLGSAVDRISEWYGNVIEITVYECEIILTDEDIQEILEE